MLALPGLNNFLFMNPGLKGWHSRGYLPHFDGGEIPQFVTFRLADSLPQKVLERWQFELKNPVGQIDEIQLRRRIEAYLDHGFGCCFLKQPEIADLVQNAILFFDAKRYKLHAWTIMPNHVHFLITPLPGVSLSQIIHSIKSFTGTRANKLLNRAERFWQSDYYDRYIRDYEHFEKTVAYIENNPVKANLCESKTDWKYGSAAYTKK